MSALRSEERPFWLGVRLCAPIAVSVIPFAIVFALSASQAGMSVLSTVGMSVIVFAGASQLVALELARGDAPAAFIIGAAIIVNLRFVLYSASLATHMRDVPTRTRAFMAYLLTDQAFALSVRRKPDEHSSADRIAFYIGAAISLWIAWQVGTVLGMVLGSSVPAGWSLEFSVALVFIALVVPSLDSLPAIAVATTSIVVYLLAASLPFGLALLPAAAAGIVAGELTERAVTT